MAQLTELHKRDTVRRRQSIAVALGLLVLVLVGTGWAVAAGIRDHSGAIPAAPPPPSSAGPAFGSLPGTSMGRALLEPITAYAPSGWSVLADETVVWAASDEANQGVVIVIGGPVLKVWDEPSGKAVRAPADYAGWLRTRPGLTVLEDTTVTVDGHEFPQLTMRVAQDAVYSSDSMGVRIGYLDGGLGEPWAVQRRGTTFTETVLTVKGKTMLVRAFGATSEEQDQLLATGLNTVLSNMTIG
jgi:hypothetical protein